ncbi:thioredoxin domain-containing protein [soil metagenome]
MKTPLSLISILLGLSLNACGEEANAPPPPAGPNRLADEKSPYLRQHADNPVDWYPWGEEAFAMAREENKPIFLSVGYSTCHWCHVMARESFSDPEIAAVMNKHFINIKLDREERPDVDQVYMTFVQATTGSGGWPMSVWLTPDLKPFVGGTYFPPQDKFGRPGFKSVLEQLAAAWKRDEKDIRAHAGQITEQLRSLVSGSDKPADELPPASLLDEAFEGFSAAYDETHGGFGPAPKFPRPAIFGFLHHYAGISGTNSDAGAKAIAMGAATLRKMADGGIQDHLGGGFHRYSVDTYWHIPHYEKMLYDQAQLAIAYLDAARLAGDESFRDTARDILAYVSRRMTHPDGGFYSAEDADSLRSENADHKTEGAFYIWEKQEIDKLLGNEAPLFNFVYGVEADGNAPDGSDPHGDLAGTNTLIRRHNASRAAEKFDISVEAAKTRLAEARRTLFEAREKRHHPHRDEKILTAWNGLMISAYARAYQDLGDRQFLTAAASAAGFIRKNLYDNERGVLLRSYLDGPAAIDGFASDYAFLIQGLLDLYEAGFDHRWLAWADALQAKQDELFWDDAGGGYFASSGKDPSVLLRSKELHDGAEPSENSVAALNLQRLGAMLDQPERLERLQILLRAFTGQLGQAPTAAPLKLVALDAARSKPAQVVIAGDPASADTRAMLDIVRRHPRPHQVVLLADSVAGQDFLGEHAEFYQSVSPADDKATAYVCENFVCHLPTNDPAELKTLLTAEKVAE